MHLTQYLKTSHPDAEEVEYFTDGCAVLGEIYGLKARWNLFATSHGKSPCDGVGGTVKREDSTALDQMAKPAHVTAL
ncbi:hypothetical protein FOCC_FOCC004037 [Frankliniella occidentalis]|nr:hypothetical protein FOCC_FOCC004037 [Frankliniella occidentalis]